MFDYTKLARPKHSSSVIKSEPADLENPEPPSFTSSKCTIIEKKLISPSINNKNLTATLQRYYDTSDQLKLQKILDFSIKPPSSSSKAHRKTASETVRTHENSIMDEFTKITNQSIWDSVLHNFKTKPQGLFNIIKGEPKRKPIRKRKKPLKIDEKRKICFKTFDFLEVSHEEPKESQVVTFKNSENVPEDWFYSLLFYRICQGCEKKYDFMEEISQSSGKIPRTHEGIELGIKRGLEIVEGFLMEMLGTVIDFKIFKEKYNDRSILSYEILYKKCESMRKARELTVKILKLIRKREKSLKLLEYASKDKNNILLFICKTNQKLRMLIGSWLKDPSIPFISFIFNAVSYLHKIQKDALIIQGYL